MPAAHKLSMVIAHGFSILRSPLGFSRGRLLVQLGHCERLARDCSAVPLLKPTQQRSLAESQRLLCACTAAGHLLAAAWSFKVVTRRCCTAPVTVAFQASGVPLVALSGAAAFRWKRSCFRFDVKLRALSHASVPRIVSISQTFSLPVQGFHGCLPPAQMRYSLQQLASQGTLLPSSNCHKGTWSKLSPAGDESKSYAGKHQYHSVIALRSCSLMLHHHASMAGGSTVCKRLSCKSCTFKQKAPCFNSNSSP